MLQNVMGTVSGDYGNRGGGSTLVFLRGFAPVYRKYSVLVGSPVLVTSSSLPVCAQRQTETTKPTRGPPL